MITSQSSSCCFKRRRRRRNNNYDNNNGNNNNNILDYEQGKDDNLLVIRKCFICRLIKKISFLLIILERSTADDNVNNNNNNGNNSNKNYNNNNNDNNNNNKGVVATWDFCKRNHVQVTRLSVLCDTPGAYYYGSHAYRNSEVCMSGDKANLDITFRVPKTIMEDVIFLEVELGIYDHFQSVSTNSVCNLDIEQINYIDVGDDDTACPRPGTYRLKSYYTVPSIRDYNFHYTPDVKMTFMDQQGRRIGCVSSGPVAIHRANDAKALHGLIAFGISFLLFILIFSILLFLSYKRKKRLEHQREKRSSSPFSYTTNIGNNGATRYQYFRTLPNGQVVPIQHHPPPMMIQQPSPQQPSKTSIRSPDDDEHDDDSSGGSSDDDPLNISNPAYNETHVPTRPII